MYVFAIKPLLRFSQSKSKLNFIADNTCKMFHKPNKSSFSKINFGSRLEGFQFNKKTTTSIVKLSCWELRN